jgi:hypothetical protein
MEYSVVPFVASVGINQGSGTAAEQLQNMINQHVSEGWEYVRLEQVETYIAGSNGCLGIGATASRYTTFSMAVFCRK